MNVILIKEFLSWSEREKIEAEFPNFRLIFEEDTGCLEQQNDKCSLVEIVYGCNLTYKELEKLPQLRWIHCPNPNTDCLCLNEISKRENIIVTTTNDENAEQSAEFAMSAFLAFSKNLFIWSRFDQNTKDQKEFWKQSMWQAQGKTILQIGLGNIGSAIAEKAKQFGFKVWGAQDPSSFHPSCDKVFSHKELHSVLPAADIVCVAYPRNKIPETLLAKRELSLMKPDSVLVLLGSDKVVDMSALEAMAGHPKLRGIFIDTHKASKIKANSPLWTMPNVFITPGVSSSPQSTNGEGIKTFIFNLRQFLRGGLHDMKNVILPKTKTETIKDLN